MRIARVGLIEAGGAATDPRIAEPAQWPLLQGSAIDWAYRTVPQPHTANRVHEWARGKVIGGSTALNAMAHVRGAPGRFRVRGDCAGWGYADLMPYFLRSEHYAPGANAHHAVGGPLHLIRPSAPHPVTEAYMAAGAEIGLAPTDDHNGARMAGRASTPSPSRTASARPSPMPIWRRRSGGTTCISWRRRRCCRWCSTARAAAARACPIGTASAS